MNGFYHKNPGLEVSLGAGDLLSRQGNHRSFFSGCLPKNLPSFCQQTVRLVFYSLLTTRFTEVTFLTRRISFMMLRNWSELSTMMVK